MPDSRRESPCNRLNNAGRNEASAYILKFTSAPEAIIHHIAGMRRMAHTETRSTVPFSDAPRAGSRSHSNAGNTTNAGRAAVTIAVRHPNECAMELLKK